MISCKAIGPKPSNVACVQMQSRPGGRVKRGCRSDQKGVESLDDPPPWAPVPEKCCAGALRRWRWELLPEVLEPRRRQLGIAHGVLYRLVPQIGLKSARIVAFVC